MAVSGSSKGGSGKGGNADSIRAGKAHVELTAEDAGLRNKLKEAKLTLMKWGGSIAKVGAGIAGAGASILAPLTGAFKGALDRSAEISRLAKKLGVSTEQLSEFAYACETTGMSFEDMTGQFENLAERIAQGAEGSGEAAETFKKLGIDAAALKLKNPIDQMIELARAMQKVTNQTDRLGMLSSLGGDQFQWMENLFAKGPEGIAQLMAEARDVGASLSTEASANATKVSAAFARAWASVKGLFFSIGEAMLPLAENVESAMQFLVGLAKGAREFIQDNRQLIQIIGAVAAAVVGIGSAVVAVGGVLAGVGVAIGGFASAAAILFNPITLKILAIVAAAVALVVAIGAIVRAFLKFTSVGQSIGRVLSHGFSFFFDIFKTTWGGVIDAIANGDLQGAWDIALQGLTATWKLFIVGLQSMWNNFKMYVVDSFIIAAGEMQKYLPDSLAGTNAEIDAAIAENLARRKEARDKAMEEALQEANDARAKLQEMVDAQAAKRNAAKLGTPTLPDITRYDPKVTDRIKGLFQAPNFNQALGYGDNVKVTQATLDTAKNTGVIAKEIKKLDTPRFGK